MHRATADIKGQLMHQDLPARRTYRDVEVDEMPDPNSERDVQEHDQQSHAHVYAWTGKSRIEDRERDARGSKASSSGDVSCAAEGKIAQNTVREDLRIEDFE